MLDPNHLALAKTAFRRAIFIVGGQAEMAELLGISQQGVSLRLRRNTAPTKTNEELRLIEAATGVSRHDLRPDLYPPEERVPAPCPPAQHPAAHPSASAPIAPQAPGAGVDGSSPALDYPSADPLEGMAA